jgi:hypothetical protein
MKGKKVSAKIEKIKQHVKEHKEAYITGVVSFITGAAVGAVCLSPQGRNVIGSVFINGHNNKVVNNTNVFVGGGRMSKIVSYIDKEGKEHWFQSQAEAARHLGVTTTDMSHHLNQGRSLPNGATLTRRGLAA